MISFHVHLSGAVTVTEDDAPLHEIPWGIPAFEVAQEIKKRIEEYDRGFVPPTTESVDSATPGRMERILEALKSLGVSPEPR